MLAERKRDDLFYKGIKPISLRKCLKTIMEQDKKLSDTTKPPSMAVVIESAQKYLKKDCYDSEESEREDGDMLFEDSDDDGLGELSSSEEESKCKPISRSNRKVIQDTREKKSKSARQKVEPEQRKDSVSAEVLKQLERLTTQVEKQSKQWDSAKRPLSSWSGGCWMCGNRAAHLFKDCPETVKLMAAGIIKFNVDGRVVKADRKILPKADTSGGGIAKVLKNEIANKKGRASSLEIDKCRFQTLNASYDCLELNNDNPKYLVMPADCQEKTYKKDEGRIPYERPTTRSQSKEKRREIKEKIKEHRVPIPQKKVFVKVPNPPKVIIKRPVEKVPDKDIEMKIQPPPKEDKVPSPEVTVEQPIVLPPRVTVQPEPVQREEQPPKKEILRHALDKPKVASPDIKLQVGNDKKGKLKPKRASPAFKFSSEIQQEVDQDELLRKILESPVQLTLRELLSSYEMSKHMNSATKTQKIPMDDGIKSKAKPK